MHKQKVLILIFLCLCCTGLKLASQITANVTQGCSPLNVSFTGVTGASAPSWTFGVGSGSSFLANPFNTYISPGNYNVTYTAMVSGSPVSYSLQITVNPNPVGSFTYTVPSTHCAPMTVQFTGSGGSAGTTYGWLFGDLSGSTGATTTHNYTSHGAFSPTMTITDFGTGCVGSATGGGTIYVSTPPTVLISGSAGLSACTAPFVTSLSGNGSTSGSPITNNLSYSWTFGNGSPPSTAANPPAISFGQGQFVVSLTVTDDNQCANTSTALVTVTQPTIAATVAGTVCINAPFPVTVQSSQPNSYWNMGDGATEVFNAPTSPFTNTVHIYSSPGPKVINITVVSGTCQTTITKNVFVEQVQANFTALPPTSSCGPSMNVTYVPQTTVNTGSSLNYYWAATLSGSAYDHATFLASNAMSPTYTYYQNSFNPYTIYEYGIPTMGFYVESNSIAHCKSLVVQHLYDSLMRPTAWFNKNKREGCVGLSVNFRDSSFTSVGRPVTSYTWNNGANPAVTISGTGTVQPQTFVYSSPGTYTPFLTISTLGGCSDVSFVDTIIVVNPPTVNMTYTPNLTVCAGQPLQVNLSASPSSTAIQHWHVTTDEGFFSGCITNSSPTFPLTHVGVHGFTISATQNGCNSTLPTTQSVTVTGPIGKLRYETSCTTRKVVTFYSDLEEVQTATLSFGDNTSTVITGNATGSFSNVTTHTYAATGNYVVTLKSINASNSCPAYTYTTPVSIRDIQAVIGTPAIPPVTTALLCAGDSIIFDGAASVDEQVGCMRGYIWNFNAPPTATAIPLYDNAVSSIKMGFPVAGIYTVSLMVKDENGCVDVQSKLFRVSSANPSFTFNSNPICFSDNPALMFNTTTTTTTNPDAITQFNWNYGDFSSPFVTTQTTTASHSFFANPPSRTYNVVLTATNSANCVSSVTHAIKINNPSASFSAPKYFVCVPEPLTFTCPPPVYATYTMSYSDSLSPRTTSAVNMFQHNFTTTGNHAVTLTVKDSAGCVNSSSLNIIGYVTPIASFTTVGASNFCARPLATIIFTSTSTTTDPVNSAITSYIWDLGTGPFATPSPSAINTFSAGTQTIFLTVAPQQGICPATFSTNIYVYGTHAYLNLNKTKFCLGETIIASLDSVQDVLDWNCNVGFGIQPSPVPVAPTQSISFTYTNALQTGTTQIIATIDSPHNACILYPTPRVIEIINLNPDFKRNLELTAPDSIHCLNVTDQFTHGVNTATTTSVTYSWNFGNGATTSAIDPVYVFPQPGTWPVTLTVKAPSLGCEASRTKNMIINALPTVTLSAKDNCPNTPFLITGSSVSGIVSGTWSPAQNIVSPVTFSTPGSPATVFVATATAAQSVDLFLSVTDGAGCTSTLSSQHVFIQQPLNLPNQDTTVIIGQPVPIAFNAGPGYSYSWTPLQTDLSCVDCHNPISTTTVNITYTVLIADDLGCAEVARTYSIIVEPKTSVDVPSAFTPNGDGINDIVYVGGWGIRKLNYFKIYNRWGQLLFETNDIAIGWNGFFNGLAQNMETYVYQVSADTYVDEKPLIKTGTIKLIR